MQSGSATMSLVICYSTNAHAARAAAIFFLCDLLTFKITLPVALS
jgi:hypothetical protein